MRKLHRSQQHKPSIQELCQSTELSLKSDKAQMESQSMHIIFGKDNEAKKQQMYGLVDNLNDQFQDIKENLDSLPFRTGLVTANLDTELKSKIFHSVQAYHGHFFIGNHCNKYLKKGVYDNTCDSVVRVTKAVTNRGFATRTVYFYNNI